MAKAAVLAIAEELSSVFSVDLSVDSSVGASDSRDSTTKQFSVFSQSSTRSTLTLATHSPTLLSSASRRRRAEGAL